MTQYTVGGITGEMKFPSSDEFWQFFPGPVAPHSLLIRQDGTVEEGFEFTTYDISTALAYLPGGRQNYVSPGPVYDALVAAGYTLTAI